MFNVKFYKLMKKITKLLLLSGLLLLGAGNAWALSGGETLYFQVPSAWQEASAKFSVYFYNDNTNAWPDENKFATQLNGMIYTVSVPNETNGTWTTVIIARNAPANTSPNFEWGQSGNISIGSGNFVYGFDYNNTNNGGAPAWYTLNNYSIQFDNSANWTTVKAYTYNGSVTPDLSTYVWPGTVMTENNGLYELTFYAVQGSYIVLDNGDDNTGDGTQTFDEPLGNYKYALSTKNDESKKYDVDITKAITPTANGYATFFDPVNKFYIPEGVSAYTGEYNNVNQTLSLHALLTNPSIVPENTPIVLKASSSTSFDITLSYATAGSVDGTNNLHGTDAEITTPTNAYVLGYQNSTTAFYSFSGNTIPANRAYLQISDGAALAGGIRIIESGNDATSLQNIEASDAAQKFIENGQLFIRKNGIVYDITGRIVK